MILALSLCLHLCWCASVMQTKVPLSWRYADNGYAQMTSASFLFTDTTAPVAAWPTIANVNNDTRNVHVHDALNGDQSFYIHRDAAAQVLLCMPPTYNLANDSGTPPLPLQCNALNVGLNASNTASAMLPVAQGGFVHCDSRQIALCNIASGCTIVLKNTVPLGDIYDLAFDHPSGHLWIAARAGLFVAALLPFAAPPVAVPVAAAPGCAAVAVAASATEVSASLDCGSFGVFVRANASAARAGRWWHMFTPGVIDQTPTSLDYAPDGSVWMADNVVHQMVRAADGVRIQRYGAVEGLPIPGARVLATTQFGTVFIGTSTGVVVRSEARGWQLLRGGRWLPGGRAIGANFFDGLRVRSIAALEVSSTDTGVHGRPLLSAVVVVTDSGISVINEENWTLQFKAQYIQGQLAPRHFRFNLTTDARLKRFADVTTWFDETTDNDGLHTAAYASSQAYRFAVTGDVDAHTSGMQAFGALEFLQSVTGIKGMVARSVEKILPINVGGRWWRSNATADLWFWKGDTSSDEMSGHLGVYPLIFDMLTVDASERARAAAAQSNVVRYIAEHGYTLVDANGEVTRWGVWSPSQLNDNATWEDERGLNSAEMLGFLAGAVRVNAPTNASAALYFQKHFDQLIKLYGYGANLENLEIANPADMAFFDDNLGKYAVRLLLYYAYGQDPSLDLHIDRMFPQYWSRGRRARIVPDFFLYALWYHVRSQRGKLPVDVLHPEAYLETHIRVLQQWPTSMLQFPVVNSDRWDIELDPEVDDGPLLHPLPRDEICAYSWAHSAMMTDGCDGRDEANPKDYLEAYWLGRFHGFV
jgi:hypothetical protein